MPFGNPIVGGESNLIRTAIQSPNYVPGVSGWTINRDGSAEFNNVTIRGTFIVSDPDGSYVKIFDENPGDGAVIELRLPDSAATTIVPSQIRSGTATILGSRALAIQGPNLDGNGVATIYLASDGAFAGAMVVDANWIELVPTAGVSIRTDGDIEFATSGGSILWQVQVGTPLFQISMPVSVVGTGNDVSVDGNINVDTAGKQIIFTSDTNLFRNAANELKTDDSFTIGGNLSVTGIGRVIDIIKASDETVNNSSAFQNDNELTLSVTAGTYDFWMECFFNSNATADFKSQFTLGSGTIGPCSFMTNVPQYGSTNANGLVTGIQGDGTNLPYNTRGSFTATGTTTFTWQWAQNTANASNTIVRAGSRLWVRKVS